MAAAETIFFPSAPVYTDASLRVAQTASVALADTEQAVVPGKKRKSGPILVSRIVAQPKASDSDGDYMQKLVEYMAAVLAVSTEVARNQSQMSQIMTNQSQAYIELSKQEAAAAEKAITAYEKAVEAQAHKNWLQRVISAVVGAVILLVGVLTLQPEIALAGAFMLIMTAIPVSDGNGNQTTIMGLLMSKLSSNLGLKIVEEIGIMIGMAVVMAGIGGGISALTEGASEGAATAGASDASEEIEMSAMNGVEDAGEDAAEEESAASEGSQETSFASKALNAAVSKLRSQLAQMMFVINPVTDIAKKCGASDTNAEYIGMSAAIAANITSFAKDIYDGFQAAKAAGEIKEGMGLVDQLKAGAASNQSISNMVTRLEESFKGSEYKGFVVSLYKGTIYGLKIGNTALMAAAGSYGIEAGQQEKIASDRLRDMGDIQADQSLYSDIETMMNSNMKQVQSTADAVNQNLSMMNSRWDAYAAPYQTAVEVMG